MSTLAQQPALIEGIRSEIPDVIAVYLFGSAAAGELRPDSDIDLAVLLVAPQPAARLWSLAQSLAVSVGRGCGEFEDRVYSDYARLNEERRHILGDIRERGCIYG